jgi:hypothetical protein
MVCYCVQSLGGGCSAVLPHRRERLELLERSVRVLAHQLAFEAGLPLGLLLDLAGGGGEHGGECAA